MIGVDAGKCRNRVNLLILVEMFISSFLIFSFSVYMSEKSAGNEGEGGDSIKLKKKNKAILEPESVASDADK